MSWTQRGLVVVLVLLLSLLPLAEVGGVQSARAQGVTEIAALCAGPQWPICAGAAAVIVAGGGALVATGTLPELPALGWDMIDWDAVPLVREWLLTQHAVGTAGALIKDWMTQAAATGQAVDIANPAVSAAIQAEFEPLLSSSVEYGNWSLLTGVGLQVFQVMVTPVIGYKLWMPPSAVPGTQNQPAVWSAPCVGCAYQESSSGTVGFKVKNVAGATVGSFIVGAGYDTGYPARWGNCYTGPCTAAASEGLWVEVTSISGTPHNIGVQRTGAWYQPYMQGDTSFVQLVSGATIVQELDYSQIGAANRVITVPQTAGQVVAKTAVDVANGNVPWSRLRGSVPVLPLPGTSTGYTGSNTTGWEAAAAQIGSAIDNAISQVTSRVDSLGATVAATAARVADLPRAIVEGLTTAITGWLTPTVTWQTRFSALQALAAGKFPLSFLSAFSTAAGTIFTGGNANLELCFPGARINGKGWDDICVTVVPGVVGEWSRPITAVVAYVMLFLYGLAIGRRFLGLGGG